MTKKRRPEQKKESILLFTGSVLLVLAAIISLLLDTGEPSVEGKPVSKQQTEAQMTVTTAAPAATTVMETTTTTTFVMPESASLTVTAVLQLPELPTGCEITSLTALLNYLGYSVTKTELADQYLNISMEGGVSFSEYFVGSPYVDTSFGCFAPVIVEAAEEYFAAVSAQRVVTDLSGCVPETLYEQVARGNPVIVWTTMNLCQPQQKHYWNLPDGTPVYFYAGEHCMLLTGFDKAAGTVTVCDPLKGVVTYDMALFETRFEQMLQQAIIIE